MEKLRGLAHEIRQNAAGGGLEKPIPIAVTGDDVGMGDVELFERYLGFFNEWRVPLTLFVTPCPRGRPLDEDHAWVRALRKALDDGHDLQLHGYEHKAFEFGLPPPFMLERSPSARRTMEDPEARERVVAGHTVAVLQGKLEKGIEIFRRALGFDPLGFRAPVAMVCPAMFEALANVGIVYDSSLAVSPVGWHYMMQRYTPPEDDPWDPDVPCRPFIHTAGIVEIPLSSEYSAHATWDDIGPRANLMISEHTRTAREGGVFIPVNHFHFMYGTVTHRRLFDESELTLQLQGEEIYRRLFEYLQVGGNENFVTLAEVYSLFSGEAESSSGGES